MTLLHGREFLNTPGPTTVPDRVLRAMHRPAVDIYGSELLGTTQRCLDGLRTIFRTDGEIYIYAASGHGAWEAALSNCLSRGEKVLVLESGMFAEVWGEMARVLGIETEALPSQPRRATDPDDLERRLRADGAGEIKAVLAVQIDTAAGLVNDIEAIGRAMANAGHDALLMVDTVASLACMPFEMDAWGVDVAVAGSQKGLMVPPGLGFVAAGDRARARHRKADLVTRYWDWTMRDGPEHYMKYCGTPPEHLLFGLSEALDMLREEGLANVVGRHATLAAAARAAVAEWSRGAVMAFNAVEPAERADSVTTVRMTAQDPGRLIDFCRETCGVTLGVGIGPVLSGKAFRIAHMGHINAPMLLGTLATVETALIALDIAHGEGGIVAAARSLSDALAESRAGDGGGAVAKVAARTRHGIARIRASS